MSFGFYTVKRTFLLCTTYLTILVDIICARLRRYKHYKGLYLPQEGILLDHSAVDPEQLYRQLRFPTQLLNGDEIDKFYIPRLRSFIASPLQYGIYTASCNLIDYCCYRAIDEIDFHSRKLISTAVDRIKVNEERRLHSNNHLLLNYLAEFYCSVYLHGRPTNRQTYRLTQLIAKYFDENGCSIEGSSSYQELFTYWLGRLHYFLLERNYCNTNSIFEYAKLKLKESYRRTLSYTVRLNQATDEGGFVIGDITPDIIGLNPYDKRIAEDIAYEKIANATDSLCLTSSLPYVISNKNTLTIGRLRNHHRNIVYDHSHFDFGCLTWSYNGTPIIVDPGRINYITKNLLGSSSHSGIFLPAKLLPPSLGKITLNKSFIDASDQLTFANNRLSYLLSSEFINWRRQISSPSVEGTLVIEDAVERTKCSLKDEVHEDIFFHLFFSPNVTVSHDSPSNAYTACQLSISDYQMATSYGHSVTATSLRLKTKIRRKVFLRSQVTVDCQRKDVFVNCRFTLIND